MTTLQPLCIVCLTRDVWSTLVCGGCYARMRSDLFWLEWAYFWLEEQMAELQPGWHAGSIHAHQSEAAAPFPLQILDAREHIIGILRSWARLIGEEYTPAGPGPADAGVRSVTAWILARLGWCSEQPWCDQFAGELADARKLAYGLAPWEEHRRQLRAPCPGCDQLTLTRFASDDVAVCRNRECGRVLDWAHYEALDSQWDQLIAICEAVALDPSGDVADVDPDDPAQRLLTTAQASAAAGVPESTIRTWAERGRITAVPIVGPSPHYRESEVLAAEAGSRRRRRRRAIHREPQAAT